LGRRVNGTWNCIQSVKRQQLRALNTQHNTLPLLFQAHVLIYFLLFARVLLQIITGAENDNKALLHFP
jgi:hypothetical protein